MTTAVMTGQTSFPTTVQPRSGFWDSINPFKHDPTVYKVEALKTASDNLKSQFAMAASEKNFDKRVAALTSVITNGERLQYETLRTRLDSTISKLSFGGFTGGMGGVLTGGAISIASTGPVGGAIVLGGMAVVLACGAVMIIKSEFGAEAKFHDNAKEIGERSLIELQAMYKSNPDAFKKAFDTGVTNLPTNIVHSGITKLGDPYTTESSRNVYAHKLYGQILNAPTLDR